MNTDNFKSEEMLSQAYFLIKENKINDAMQLLYDIIAEYPDFGKAYNHIAWIYETKIADMQKAEEHYINMIEKAEESVKRCQRKKEIFGN